METRQFEYSDGKSDKFWRIALDASSFCVHFGRRGTAGQSQTKEFATPDAARKAHDKLIEEKVKKGYTEVVPTGTIDVPPPPAPKATEPSPPSPPQSLPAIDLTPEEWAFASWRPRPRKQRPSPPAFHPDEGWKRLDRALDRSVWSVSWDDARMPVSMTREEARFWVEEIAKVHQYRLHDIPGGANPFAQPVAIPERSVIDLSAPWTVDQACAHLSTTNLPCAILLPLYHLFAWDEFLQLLHTLPKHRGGNAFVIDGVFRTAMEPYLSSHELDTLRGAIRQWLPDVEWPEWGRPSWVLPLAGQIGGLHHELQARLDSMPQAAHTMLYPSYLYDIVFGLNNPAGVIEHTRRRKLTLNRPEYVAAWLAHTEFTALDWVIESIAGLNKGDGQPVIKAFAKRVNAPEAAPAMLELLNSKNPAPAKEWLDTHPREAFHGLLPLITAHGKTPDRLLDIVRASAESIPEAERTEAYSQLTDAARRKLEHRETSEAGNVAAEVPTGLQQAFQFAARQKLKPPSWITPANVPAPLIAGGRLSDDYVTLLLAALKHGDPRVPHPFVLAMRCYATPASLDAFAAAVFEQWRLLGMESREKWALFTLGAFGSDRCALQLAPYVRNWPGESKSAAALLGLEVLRNIGTDTAILQINAIAQKTKFAALKKRAQECMEEVAKDRNLSRDELEDRIVPDCGLDSRGTRIFDFGPRQFELRIGEGLKPVVVGPDGARKPNLPPVNSKDDPDKARAATEEWKVVKKQVADVAKTQVFRLEQALVTQRRWTRPDFEALLVHHPLMTNLVRLLVWGVYREGRLSDTFRVAEDCTYTDPSDQAIQLPDDAIIGLPHPLQMEPAVKNAWGGLFGDYEILPPFAQLSRPVQFLTAEELRGNFVERHTGVKLLPVVFGSVLQSRGWMRGPVGDGGSIFEHVKYFPSANLTAVLNHTGMIVGYVDIGEDVKPEKLFFVRGYSRGEWAIAERPGMEPLCELDRVVTSEVLTDLDYLASKEKK